MDNLCPACKNTVNEGASKCHHCGFYIRGKYKWTLFIVRVIEFLALLAVVATLWFLYKANDISQRAFEENRKANLEALVRVDSSLALLRRQVQIQEEQASTEKKGQLWKEKEFLETNKPVIVITPLSLTQTDSGVQFYFSIKNRGPVSAERIAVYVRTKLRANRVEKGDTAWYFDELTPERPTNFSMTVPYSKGADILWYVDVKYKWPGVNYEGLQRASFIAYFQKNDINYKVRMLDDTKHRMYWGKS